MIFQIVHYVISVQLHVTNVLINIIDGQHREKHVFHSNVLYKTVTNVQLMHKNVNNVNQEQSNLYQQVDVYNLVYKIVML